MTIRTVLPSTILRRWLSSLDTLGSTDMSSSKDTVPPVAAPVTELDALIAAAGSSSSGTIHRGPDNATKGRAARSLPDLALATRAISGWYQNALGYKPSSPATVEAGRGLNLDDVVRQHVAMRREWEGREAVSLAAALTKVCSRVTAVPVPTQVTVGIRGLLRGTALLIDDSSDILVTVGAFLEAFGFAVTVASNSESALQILASKSMDLLITDHAMPGMTGKDLVVEALQQNPALRAMIITGYPNLQELRDLPASVKVLAKPFRRAELFARLQALFEPQPKDDTTEPLSGELCAPPS